MNPHKYYTMSLRLYFLRTHDGRMIKKVSATSQEDDYNGIVACMKFLRRLETCSTSIWEKPE
jgi:hypothetical protein